MDDEDPWWKPEGPEPAPPSDVSFPGHWQVRKTRSALRSAVRLARTRAPETVETVVEGFVKMIGTRGKAGGCKKSTRHVGSGGTGLRDRLDDLHRTTLQSSQTEDQVPFIDVWPLMKRTQIMRG